MLPNSITNLNQTFDSLSIDPQCEWNDEINGWLEQYDIEPLLCEETTIAGQLWIERDGIDGFSVADMPIVSATVKISRYYGDYFTEVITVTTDATGYYTDTILLPEPYYFQWLYDIEVDTSTFSLPVVPLSYPYNNTMIVPISWSSTERADFSYFSCAAVTEIPISECEALVAIHTETYGHSWTNSAQSGWVITNTPCSWTSIVCTDGHVTQLQLVDVGLTGFMPSELGQLTELTHLNLWNNRLLSLPAELADLTKLEQLNIGRNPWQTFPTHIDQMSNLLGLYISDAGLTTVPFDIGNLTALQDLHLWENQLTEIPADIANLTNLERLIVRDNALQSLPAELTNLTNLARLDVKHNNLATLPMQLQTIDSLNEIDIQGNRIPCSQVDDWTSVQGACIDTSDIPLAVSMGEIETDSSATVLLFLPFVMAAVTKQIRSQ